MCPWPCFAIDAGQVVLEEAKESYPDEAVHQVNSNSVQDLESNVDRVQRWLEDWRKTNQSD